MKLTSIRNISFGIFLLLGSPVFAQVAQSPLLTKTVNVRPNIALVLDTSGSMDWECVYAKQVNDAFVAEGLSGSNIPGLTTSCLTTSDPRQNSPVNNLLYYNPKTTYEPGYVLGVKQSNASVGTTSGSISEMFLPKSGQDPTTYTTSAQLSNTANYDTYAVTSTTFKKNGSNVTSNPFGKHFGSRTDCGSNDPCTLTQERQNIANWKAYHRDRLQAAKTGISGAFANQADAFRLSYASLSSTLTTMTDYGVAKNSFFTWLDGRTSNGGTPLLTAFDNAGKFYSSSANSGPWGTKPWSPPTETAADHLSCRRSYTILITDGYYNDSTPPTPGNIDATKGPKHTYALDTTKTYQYVPGDKTDTRSKGKSDTTSGSGGYSDTMADIAMKYWVTDLRPDLRNDIGKANMADPPFWQNMITYTVSFGAPGKMTEANVASAQAGNLAWVQPVANTSTTIDDMRHAAWNGGGEYLAVTDAAAFANRLGNVINSISTQEFSQAGVAASAVTLTAGTKKFVPFYTTGTWWGNVQMLNLVGGTNGSVVWQVVATDANGQPSGATTLPAPASRNIMVWVNASTQAVPFTYANVNTAAYNLKGTNTNLQMSTAVTTDIVNFLRGDRTNEGTTMLKRAAVLGDIVNSTPAFVKNNTNPLYENLPASTPGLSSYAAYMTMKANRTEGVLIVGANDGMVHSFAEGAGTLVDGHEVFAYVPRSVLGKMEALSLSNYTYNHTYLADGPLNETDAYLTTPDLSTGAPTTGWRNVVVGTTGAGAKAVYALNTTDPFAMNGRAVLWEINADPAFPQVAGNSTTAFAELGHVLTQPQSGITPSGDWVTIFGNGYSSKSGQASLFIVNTGTGQLLKEIKTDLQAANGLGGVRLVLNSSKQIIGVYAGDLRGRVWKFDLSSSSSTGWKLGNGGNALFTAMDGTTPLPITAAPAVLERTDQAGFKPSYLVTVATGKLFEATDPATTTPTQYAFGLWDKLPFGSATSMSISNTDLESLSLSVTTSTSSRDYYKVSFTSSSVSAINWTTKLGWKLALNINPGQRVIYPLNMAGDVVKIDSVAPVTSSSSCQNSTALGLSVYLDPLSGVCLSGGSLDTNGDGSIDSSDIASCGLSTQADGMDVVLTILNSKGQESGIYSNQSASEGYIFKGKNPPPPDCTDAAYAAANPAACGGGGPLDCTDPAYRLAHPGTCAGSTLNRSWRQIFPRAN